MQTKLHLFRELYSQIYKKTGYVLVIMMLTLPMKTLANVHTSSVASVHQQITVSGTVVDDQGNALPGVSVMIKGTTMGQVTNIDGRYSIAVSNEEAVLIFSFVGYTTQEIMVGSQREISVTMLESATAIDELVVTGYGTAQKRATITGSVSTVSNKELTVTKNENVVNMLAGKMPGLRITQRTSQPGAYNTKMDVRGYGADPLFVVDGVPRDKDYFSRMDPQEIESISLLKDASAAIYGIRAANGVMLITTKTGNAQDGKVDISYSGSFSLQQMLFIPDGYTITEWMTLRNEQEWRSFGNNYFSRRLPIHSDEQIADAATWKYYDWQKEAFREITPQTQHNLSINGGSEQLRYFVSLGYQRQDGCYSSGSLWADRWNFRTNVDAKITSRLSTRISVGATLGNLHEPNGGLWDVYKAAWLQLPCEPFYVNDNPEYLNGYSQYFAEFTNILGKMDSDYVGYFHKKERRLNGSLTLEYEIPGIKGLKARAFYDYFMNVPDEKRYNRMYKTYYFDSKTGQPEVAKVNNGPSSTTSRRSDVSIGKNMQLGFSYNNRFGQHSVSGTAIYEEAYDTWYDFTVLRILELNSDDIKNGVAYDQSASGSDQKEVAQRAFIGRVNYDFSSKYLLEFLFRYEASSRWPSDSRWGFFPSVSAGWRLSEENFIKYNFDFISNLKIRASWGEVGDQSNAREYPQIFVGYENHNRRGWIFEEGVPTQGVRPTAIPNPNLTWIKTQMKNIAIDFGLFRDKFTGTFELFQRDRFGLMETSSAVVSPIVGASMPDENMNDQRNFGWELELAHRNRIDKLEYSVAGQISQARRKWLYKLEEPASHSRDHWRNRYSGRYHNDDFWWGQESGGMLTSWKDIVYFDQHPLGQGTLPGDWYRVDWNGDGILNGDDDHPVATKGLPYFNYGISLGASYNFRVGTVDLTAHFQGAYKVYTQLSEIFVEALPFGGQNSLNWFLDRWHPEDPNADYWHPDTKWISGYYPLTGGASRREGTNQIMDASYCRLKTLEIGYSFPKDLLTRARIKDVRIYLSGYNLLTFTPLKNIDPERPSSEARAGGSDGGANNMYVYPNNKTYTIGASFKF